MEIITFTIVGAVLYLASDWVLNRLEDARGARFAHRSLIFFAIILALTMPVFSCMRGVTREGEAPETATRPSAPPDAASPQPDVTRK
ncbi:MAG: hypothetical protein HQM03_11010 [Magnetococcales bacterium]|nr:hypothetical protein [Magnetococcales bacterium]